KETTTRSSRMERDHCSGISQSVRSRCAIYRNETRPEQIAQGGAGAPPPDADEGCCAAQNQPKPPGANGSRRPLRFPRPLGKGSVYFGGFLKGFAKSSLTDRSFSTTPPQPHSRPLHRQTDAGRNAAEKSRRESAQP